MILKLFFRMKANLACKYKNVNTFSTLNVLRSIKRKEWPPRRTLIVIIKLYLLGWGSRIHFHTLKKDKI